jgi:UDP-N-acetylglucosamine 2-epimerase (non-hydrolysing)
VKSHAVWKKVIKPGAQNGMSQRRLRVLSVVGARPNLMKIAPIAKALSARADAFDSLLVHTGQHYDASMSAVFFDQLGIPKPDINLNVGSGSHAQQTGAVMMAFEPVVLEHRPDLVLVVGDVNSTIACALVASKLGVAVAHVEAGLRSFDRTMPEEINRVLTDQISDLLFTTEESAAANLQREGIAAERVHFVGNVMIDTLLAHRERAAALRVAEGFGLSGRGYAVLTLHRPSNVDDPEVFERLMSAIGHIARELPVVFPVHPRTRKTLQQSTASRDLTASGQLRLVDPLGYLEFLGLLQDSALVLTDSGGVQEETTILQVPCLTLRENTERPVTIAQGTNRIVGTDPRKIVEAWGDVKRSPYPTRVPPLWDGLAASRIIEILRERTPRLAA